MEQTQVQTAASYILNREKHLDRDLLPYGNPAGKDVLIFGSGIGTEVPWTIRHKAKSTVGIDLAEVSREPIDHALELLGQVGGQYELLAQDVHDLALKGEQFDLIVSNGVFEHVMDLKGVLLAFRALLRPGGRIAIFADGLWYSSIGGHIRAFEWEHLRLSPAEIKAKYPARWKNFNSAMNKMTCVDFLEAIRAVGAIPLKFNMNVDPRLATLPAVIQEIRANQQVTPTDLAVVSIGCELAFLEKL